jgi:hypothetical protein
MDLLSPRALSFCDDGNIAIGDPNGGLMDTPEVLENIYDSYQDPQEPRTYIPIEEIPADPNQFWGGSPDIIIEHNNYDDHDYFDGDEDSEESPRQDPCQNATRGLEKCQRRISGLHKQRHEDWYQKERNIENGWKSKEKCRSQFQRHPRRIIIRS